MYTYIIIGILLYFIFFVKFETSNVNILSNNNKENQIVNKKIQNINKNIQRKVECKDCKAWNSKDIQSKCDALCMKEYTQQDVRFNGNWIKKNDTDIECQCEYSGKLQEEYVGCPIGEKIEDTSDKNDCFIWNIKEANEKCPKICNKYLPDKNAEWSGKWKNTSSSTSACECSYYD